MTRAALALGSSALPVLLVLSSSGAQGVDLGVRGRRAVGM